MASFSRDFPLKNPPFLKGGMPVEVGFMPNGKSRMSEGDGCVGIFFEVSQSGFWIGGGCDVDGEFRPGGLDK